MALPIVTAILPSDLRGQENGKLDLSLLVALHPRGLMHHHVARGWKALVAAAGEQGLPLTFTYGGMYRLYIDQYNLFMSRYQTTPIAGRPTKTFQGKTWYLKPGMATAAVPGTSNHGWGCAIDTAFDTDPSDGLGPDDAASISSHPLFGWFRDNAIRFGFSFELQSEPWHIRWVVGDTVPQAVLDFEYVPPVVPPVNPGPEPDYDGDTMLYIAKPTFPGAGPNTQWLAVFESGAVRRAMNADVAFAQKAGVPFIDQDSAEQHAYIVSKFGI